MIKQDSGEYACIAEDRTRYNLGEVKEEMLAAMGLDTEVRHGGRGRTMWCSGHEPLMCGCGAPGLETSAYLTGSLVDWP